MGKGKHEEEFILCDERCYKAIIVESCIYLNNNVFAVPVPIQN